MHPPDLSTTLPYKVVESLLRALFEIDDDRRVAFVSRFRYLQAMGFPASRVGRGRKVDYGFDEVLQLVLAFQLLQLGVLPVRAVRLVRTGWSGTRGVLAAATRSGPTRKFLVLFPRALEELAPVPGDELVPASDPLGILGLSELTLWLAEGVCDVSNGQPDPNPTLVTADPACCVVLDPARLMGRVRRAFAATTRELNPEQAKRDFERFAANLGA